MKESETKTVKNKKSSFVKELENLFEELAESGRLREYFSTLDLDSQVAFVKNMAPYVITKAKDRIAAEVAQVAQESAMESEARHLQWYRELVRSMKS